MGILLGALVLFTLAPQSPEEIDAAVARLVEGDGPGAAVGILREGKVVHRKGYGLADLDKKTPVATDTPFELASVSKQFTALAVLLLVERGKLSLEDDVRKHLPELPEYDKARPMRVGDLLQHTAGLPDHLANPNVRGKSAEDFLRETAEKKLVFPTGSKFQYSNMNYRALAILVGRVAGKSMGEFLRDDVFLPLGMKRTVVKEREDQEIEGRARGYAKIQPLESPLVVAGEAGVWSTLEDMLRWVDALDAGRVAKPESLRLAFTSGKLDDGKETGYGAGWFVSKSPEGPKIYHSGGWLRFTAHVLRYPERKLSIVVLRNRYGDGGASQLAEYLANLVLDDSPAKAEKLPKEELDALPGTYAARQGAGTMRVELNAAKDGLELVAPGQLPYPLLPVSKARFRLRGCPRGYFAEFELEEGKAKTVTVEHGTDRPAVTLARR